MSETEKRRKVPSNCCIVSMDAVEHIPTTIVDAHHAFIREAARRKSRSPFKGGFSPGMMVHMERLLGVVLPRPSWFSGEAEEEGPLPDEVSEDLFEGARRTIMVNRYERDVAARRRCIEHYGLKCCGCGVKLADIYGKLARTLIHVHHVRPLSEINAQYQVDPVRDLRPVCPNCHAVLHLRKPPLTVEELRSIIVAKARA